MAIFIASVVQPGAITTSHLLYDQDETSDVQIRM